MKTVITTVGTSIFTNFLEKKDDIEDKYDDLKDKTYSEWGDYTDDINNIMNSTKAWAKNNDKASAEITSLLAICEELNDELTVHLLSTYTILSPIAAEIINDFFKDNDAIRIEFGRDSDVIEGLQVENKRDFENKGMLNLIDCIKNISDGNKQNQVLLNISSGYKAIIPYMTIMGQVYDFPIYYIYEKTDELIEIPKMPIDFDFSIIEDNYIAFESLKKTKKSNLPNIEKFKSDLSWKKNEQDSEYKRLIEMKLINEENGIVKFTVLGKIFFDKYEYEFNSDKFQRSSLVGKIVELNVFKYYVKKYKNSNVVHNKEVDKSDYDIDVCIETNDTITAIEIKPGGNAPILSNNKKSIEKKITNGAFGFILKNNNFKKVELKVFLYSHTEIHISVIDQIRELHNKYRTETEKLRWFLLKLPANYKSNVDWEITEDKIKEIYPGEKQNSLSR